MKSETFLTSRLLEFTSERELINVTGHAHEDWCLVVLKELLDNALEAVPVGSGLLGPCQVHGQ